MRTLSPLVLLLSITAITNAQELFGLAAEAFTAEKALWQSEVDGDVAGFAARLDDDFVQVTTSTGTEISILSGKDNAAASIEMALQAMEFGAFELDLENARVIDNTVILTFRFQQMYISRADDTRLGVHGVATSIWVERDEDGWRNVHFHWHSQASPGN